MPHSGPYVELRLSLPAAAFLHGAVQHMNTLKVLPEGGPEALQTSAWLEEIEATAAAACAAAERGPDESAHEALLRKAREGDARGPL
jgi:hypothetical protein